MACAPVRGDNPRASASGFSMVNYISYHTHTTIDRAHHEIFGAKVGKGGIKAER